MNKFLKEYIKLLLQEKAVNVTQAGKEKLALYVVDKGDDKSFILYDGVGLEDYIYEAEGNKIYSGEVKGFIYAILDVSQQWADEPSYGAWKVTASAAQKGYGPMMYDIAMQSLPGLTSDRGTVSPSAKNIWNYYFNNRSDVEKEPLDNFRAPATPDPNDDGRVFPGGNKNPLNYAYISKKPAKIATLTKNHNAFVKKAGANHLKTIVMAAESFWDEKYTGE